MKRAGYRQGIEWIALNDDPLVMDFEDISCQISVCLLADLFGKEAREVGLAVLAFRRKQVRLEAKKPVVGDRQYRNLRRQLSDAGDRHDGYGCDLIDAELVSLYGEDHESLWTRQSLSGKVRS